MKKQYKVLMFKAVTVIFLALAVIFLYGLLIGGAPGIWFIVFEFSALFVALCFFVKQTDRKMLVGIFTKNVVLCLLVTLVCIFVYDGINTLSVKETKIYYSVVAGHYGKGGGTVYFLDESGEERYADLNDYRLVKNYDYFEEGEKIIVTEKSGLFGDSFFSVEEVEK